MPCNFPTCTMLHYEHETRPSCIYTLENNSVTQQREEKKNRKLRVLSKDGRWEVSIDLTCPPLQSQFSYTASRAVTNHHSNPTSYIPIARTELTFKSCIEKPRWAKNIYSQFSIHEENFNYFSIDRIIVNITF